MLRLLKTVLVAAGLLAAAGCLNLSWPWSNDRCCPPPDVSYDVAGPMLDSGPILNGGPVLTTPPPVEGTMPQPRLVPQPQVQPPEAQAVPYSPANNRKK